MSDLKIGDVVFNNDMPPMVVIDFKNREDISSMSYDRSYKLCLASELEGKEFISEEDFEKIGYWIEVRGTKFPDIKRVDNIAPFEINIVKSYKIRQKKAKTVTVYE